MGRNIIDLTGQVFGRLTVICKPENIEKSTWLCKCSCGSDKEVYVVGADLRRGNTKSCGCLHKELSSERIVNFSTKHGYSGNPLHNIWKSMKQRCYNPKNKGYKNYGGRGITVCDRWLESFENFFEDVSEGYEKGLQLDRRDNDGNYEPENVRWTTSSQNNMNSRSRRNSSSKYKGVSWRKDMGMWRVKITLDRKTKHIGYFTDEVEAAKAYNKSALELFGEYAYLNKIETGG